MSSSNAPSSSEGGDQAPLSRTSRSSSAGLLVTATALTAAGVLLLFPSIQGDRADQEAARPSASGPALSPVPDVASPRVTSSPPAAPVASSPTAAASPPSPTATAANTDEGDGFIEASPTPSTSRESEAVRATERFMTAYARRPGDTQKVWWARVSPLLTAQGREDYAYVPAQKIPVTKLTGSPTLDLELGRNGQQVDEEAGHSHLGTVVLAPTNAGVYAVSLMSPSAGEWLVSRVSPPEIP